MNSTWDTGQRSRGVSEIYGTVLVISLSFMTAILLIGVGTVVIDQLGDEAEDSISEDVMVQLDDRMAAVAGSHGQVTEITFPDADSGSVGAQPDHGVVNITVEATEDIAYLDGEDTIAYKEFEIGTIEYAGTDDEVIAYQGGALIEGYDDHSTMMSLPPFDYDGELLRLDFINTSDLEHADPGGEVTARGDSYLSEQFNEEMRSLLAPMWSYEGSGDFFAPVNVTVSVETAYYHAWEEYASEGMTVSPDRTDTIPEENTVEMEFDFVGVESQPPTYEPNSILYAGDAANVLELWNRFNQNATIVDSGDGFRIDHHDSGGGTQMQQLAFYNESAGEWLIHGNDNGVPPGQDMWNNLSTFDVPNEDRYDGPDDPPEVLDWDSNGQHFDQYEFNGEYNPPICIVAYEDEHIPQDRDGIIEHLETCAANLNVPNPGDYMPTDLNVSFEEDHFEENVGDEANVTVELNNTGQMESVTSHDIALYYEYDDELILADYNRSETINEKHDIAYLEPGEAVDVELEWLPTAEDIEELFVIVGEHDADEASVTVTDEPPDLDVTIDEDTDELLPPGDSLLVNATIENEAGADADNVEVVLEDEEGNLADLTTVSIPGGESTEVELDWVAPLGEFDDEEELTVNADGVTDTHEVFPEGLADFQIQEIDPGVASIEDGLDVEIEIENEGSGPGEQDVLLEVAAETLEESQIVATDNRTIDPGETDSFTLAWESIPELIAGDDNEVTVSTADDSETVPFDVEASFDLVIDDIEPGPEEIDRSDGTNIEAPLIEQGESVALETVIVTNVGDVEDTQTVTLEDVDGDVVDSETVTLSGGEAEAIQLAWGDTIFARTGNITVSSEDASVERRIVVERDGPDCGDVWWDIEDGYRLVETVDHLQCINEEGLEHDYRLANDIDAYGTVFWDGGAGFEPIGPEGHDSINIPVDRPWDTFEGEFNGNGHTIEGLYIERPSEEYVGLFGATSYPYEDQPVGWGSTVENVIVEDVYVLGEMYVGGLVGQAGGEIRNARAEGYVEANYQLVGGLIGLGAHADIDNRIVADVEVVGGNVPSQYSGVREGNSKGIGGLIGRAAWETEIAVGYSRSDVSGPVNVGGLMGSSSLVDSQFERMYSAATVTATDPGADAGSIVGIIQSDGDEFADSMYYDGDLASSAWGEAEQCTGIWGCTPIEPMDIDSVERTDWLERPTSQMQGPSAEIHMNNLDFENTWDAVYTQNLTSGEYEDEDYPRFEWESEAEGAFQIIDVASTDDPVEGGTLNVTAEIESTYGQEETQDIWLLTDEGTPLDRNETTIEGSDFGESETKDVELTWDIEFGIEGEYDLVVRTDDHDAAHEVDIEPVEEPFFEIDDMDINETDKQAGDDVEVEIELHNTGGEGSDIVVLEEDVGGDYRYLNHTSVELDNDETTSLNLTWETTLADDDEDYTLRVRTLEDTESDDFSLEPQDPPEFNIQAIESDDPVLAGQPLTLDVTIENNGDLEATQFVSLTPAESGTLLNITEFSLEPGETTEVGLTWETPIPDIEELEVSTQDDAEIHEVTVVAPTDDDDVFVDPLDIDVDLISFDE